MSARAAASAEVSARPEARGTVRGAAVRAGGPVLAIVVLVVVFSVTSPFFLTRTNLEGLVTSAAPLLVVSCGLTFVILLGDIDLSLGAVVALAGIVVAKLLKTQYWEVSVVLGIVFGAGVGLLNGAVTVFGRIPSFIVTLGTFSVAQGVAIGITGNNAVPVFDEAFLSAFAGTGPLGVSLPIVYVVAVAGACAIVLRRTVFGQELVAVGGNDAASRLAGIRTRRTRLTGFVLAGALAGFAAVLLTAQLGTGIVNGQANLTLNAIAAVVLGGTSLMGGRGSVLGTVAGALLIATLSNGLTLVQASSYLQQAITGAIIILAVLLDRRLR